MSLKAWDRFTFNAPAERKDGQPSEMFRRKAPGGWFVAFGWGNSVNPPIFVSDPTWSWDPSQEDEALRAIDEVP